MKKFLLALLLAVPLALGIQALRSIAADIVPGQDVKSVQPIGGRDVGGKARAVQVGADGSLVISGLTSSNMQTAQKGATAAGNVTSTAASVDRQPLDVTIRDTSGAPVTSFGAPNIATALKGATAAGAPTSTAASADRQTLDVSLYGTTGVAVGTTTNPIVTNMRVGYVKTGAPSFTVSVTTTSASATGLTAGGCYRVSCSAATFFRSGTGTVTALSTDNPLYGPTVEKICIPSTDTVLAFVAGTGTATCTGTLFAVTP